MMAIWATLRSDLRSRWPALLGLVLLLGLFGGTVLTCAAGARRTDTAYNRLREWAHASQVQIVEGASDPSYDRAVRKLPGVTSVADAVFDNAALPTAPGVSQTAVTAMTSPDNSMGVSTDRVKILAGRMWHASDAHAVMVDRQLADKYRLGPGSTFRLAIIPQQPATQAAQPGHAVTVRATVTAVVAFDSQIVPATTADEEPMVLLSPPFARTALAASASYGTQLSVELSPGASVRSFTAAATALAKSDPRMRSAGMYVTDLTDRISATQRAIRPQAFALAAFAALAGLILLVIASQLLSRQLVLDSVGYPVLRALGMAPGQLLALSLARTAVVTASGGFLAAIMAIAASPLTPIGAARVAEPQPGIMVDALILGPGLALLVILPLALILPAAWRAASMSPGSSRAAMAALPERSSRTARILSAGSSVTRAIGVRMALKPGRGRTAVPVRSAMLGTVVAVAATVAALVFGASFLHLLATPAQYGQNWAEELDVGFGGLDRQVIGKVAAMQPGLTDYAAGNYGQISVNGTLVPAIGIDTLRGSGFVTMLSGHPPAGRNQIAFGAQTLRALHRSPGQRVSIVVNGRTETMTIVGTAVLAAFGQGTIIATDLGSGAVTSAEVLSVPNPQTQCAADCYNFFLARYRPGQGQLSAAAHLRATAQRLGCPPGDCQVRSNQQPSDVRDYSDFAVRNTPLILGLVLALLAIGTLAHVLVTSVRRRRHELAVLKVLGMDRAQVLGVIMWQACAVSLLALVIGLPAGVLAGRWTWALFAGSAGVPGEPVVSVLDLLAIIPVTLIVAGLVAAIPGWAAAQVRPGAALHAE